MLELLPMLAQGLSSPMGQAGLGLMSGQPIGQAAGAMMQQKGKQAPPPNLIGLLARQTTPGTAANGGWQTTTTPTIGGLLGGRGFFGG